MRPPLSSTQLRALTRQLHTTSRHLKGRHPRPATILRNKPKQWADPGFTVPTDILMSAHKSKALPFGPAVATNLIRTYTPMLSLSPSEEIGNTICTEYKVTPHDLSLLALVLLRSAGSSNTSKQQLVLARHLLATSSALSDPTATIELHKLLAKAPQNTFTVMESQQVVGRLAQIAEKGHPGALFRMGELLEGRGTKDAKAEECYRRAGEKGVGEAWVRLGRLRAKSGKTEEAEAAFKKGKELDNPHAYYYLALASPSPSPDHETYLLKAAASGVIEAAHNLGVLYQSRFPPELVLAQEWYTLAATEGFALSQVNLAMILRGEGKQVAACEWLAKAQAEVGEVGIDAGRLRKEIEAEMGGSEK